jgi:hypothetical protein
VQSIGQNKINSSRKMTRASEQLCHSSSLSPA